MIAWIPYVLTVITPMKQPVVVKNAKVWRTTIIHYVLHKLEGSGGYKKAKPRYIFGVRPSG
jgi:hypothetical protein